MTALATAIDQLVSIFTTALAGVDEGTGVVAVYDGYPGTDRRQDFVVVGAGTDADASSAAGRDWVELGGVTAPGSRQEEFVVVCYAQSFRGGDDTQATARTAAVDLFSRCETALRANSSLNGTVGPFPVDITTQALRQTTPETAHDGRWALIEFGVRIRNRY